MRLSPCSADAHSQRVPGEGWEENLKYLSGFTEGFATEIWASLTPFTSVWHLLYKIRRWWKGETKAMLAFQFLVLACARHLQPDVLGFVGCCFFYSWYQKYFFLVTCFCYQCFLKSRSVSQGGSSVWGSGCEVHVLSLAMLQLCSCEHPWSRTCVSTSNGIQWFCLFVFFNIEPYIFLSNLRSECDF